MRAGGRLRADRAIATLWRPGRPALKRGRRLGVRRLGVASPICGARRLARVNWISQRFDRSGGSG
jgi:hypothetical protein